MIQTFKKHIVRRYIRRYIRHVLNKNVNIEDIKIVESGFMVNGKWHDCVISESGNFLPFPLPYTNELKSEKQFKHMKFLLYLLNINLLNTNYGYK